MSVRRTLFPDGEGDEERVRLDFASFPSAVEERLAAATRFRELRSVIQTSPAIAYRVGGFGDPRKQAAAPIPELFREMLRRDFGISATASECAGSSGFLRELVADSFRRAIPLVEAETLSKRSALKLTIAYRALYTRLYDSVRRPFDARQLDTAAARGFWLGYTHGGVALVEIETRQRRILSLVSILSIYRALTSRGNFEQLMNGDYGGFLKLVDGQVVIDGDDALDIDASTAPIYVANWLPDGRADVARRSVYLVHDDGVLAVDLNKTLREFANQPGFWTTEDSFALSSAVRGTRHDSLLISVVAEGMPVERRFFEIDRTGKATSFEPPVLPPRSLEVFVARPDILFFLTAGEQPNDWAVVVEYGGPTARRTDRIKLAQQLKERGYIPEGTEWQLSTYSGWFVNRPPDGRLRFFAMMTVIWHEVATPTVEFATSLFMRIDCRANGSIGTALAFLQPAVFSELTLPRGEVFNETTVIVRRKIGESERLLTFDAVSGEVVVLPAFTRYDWLVAGQRQSTTLLSILNDEFDNSAGVASARDYSSRHRYEASVLEVQRDR